MNGFHNISSKGDRKRGFISVYLLYSLDKKPKSGYEILAEIKEKSGGKYAPSKGTVYPLLKELQEEGLISIKSVGKRSKNIFEVTPRGKIALSKIRKEREEMKERLSQFRNLFSGLMGDEKSDVMNLIFEIKHLSLDKEAKKKTEVINALNKCLIDLKKI